MLYPMLALLGVFIAVVLIFRFSTHFHYCKRVSKKYPGEKIQGCPVWTHTQVEEKKQDSA
jgi:hypothetical protein